MQLELPNCVMTLHVCHAWSLAFNDAAIFRFAFHNMHYSCSFYKVNTLR